MGKTTKMYESDSQPIPEKSGWSTLTTITTFDRGKTSSQKWKKESAVVPKREAAFTPSSLFVESLVEQLCKLLEKDPLSQKKLYGLICQKLYQMKLIGKTYKVEEFQFMRSYYQRALYRLFTLSNSPTIDGKLETIFNQLPSYLPLPSPINPGIFDGSRYQNDFEEIEFIARGGFGRVYRVRNKVDGCEYAIKKICFRFYGDEHSFHSLSEVRTLAKLDHCNIVAYKAAWFEPLSGLVAGEDCSSSSGSKVSPDVEPSDEVPESSVSERESVKEGDDSGDIVFTNGNEDAFKGGFITNLSSNLVKEVGLQKDYDKTNGLNHTSSKMKMLNLSEPYGSLCDHSSESSNKDCRGKKVPGTKHGIDCALLYIQMQLCKESLRKWLDLRNEALQGRDGRAGWARRSMGRGSVETALHIFEGILNGVDYMHRMSVVHHDLKPSNIFVEGYEYVPPWEQGAEGAQSAGADEVGEFPGRGRSRRQVRVGDFGLACHLSRPPDTVIDDLGESGDSVDGAMAVVPTDPIVSHGSCLIQSGNAARDGEVIGTRLYAAPEQLAGHCCLMSDTYSLGIILFELLYPFFTAMERGKVISALRSSGNAPEEFELSYPVLASLIKDMLSENPSKRPRMETILQVLHSVLPDYDSRNGKARSDSMSSDDDASLKDYVVRNGSRGNSFTFEHKEVCSNFTHSWEEMLYEENGVGTGTHCGNFTCHAVRELQDETICQLRRENSEKDEIIEELKQRLMRLESSCKNKGDILGNLSHNVTEK